MIGLSCALVASLLVIRRRNDELDATRFASTSRSARDVRLDAARTEAKATRLRTALEELLPVGVVHFDAERRVDHANERAHALLDVQPGRLQAKTVMETFLDPRAEGLIDGVPIGGAATGEIRVGDREPRVLIIRIHRPDATGAVVVLEDATELRRLQQIRTEFIDNLSHELRTPLSTVSLLAETLARDAESSDVPARMRERIAKIEVETGHLVQMVSELLDLARIEGGGQLALTDDVDLGRLAESSTERLRLFAERNAVTLIVDVAPALPTVRADEDRLGQVFVNLVHNAIKFSPDGGEVRVSVRGGRGRGRRRGRRSRDRHRQGRPEADLRAVLQDGSGPGARRRDRPRAVDRAPRRRGPRRADLGRVRGGPRIVVLVRDPGVPGAGPDRGRGRLVARHLAPGLTPWTACSSPR